MGLIVGGEWLCRGVWIIIKVFHTGLITEHTLFIIGVDLCDFEVFPEGGYYGVQDIVNLIQLVSFNLPVFGVGFSDTYMKCSRNLGVIGKNCENAVVFVVDYLHPILNNYQLFHFVMNRNIGYLHPPPNLSIFT